MRPPAVVLTVVVALASPGIAAGAEDAQAIYWRAVALHQQGKPKEAIALYEQALALGLNRPVARFNLARAQAASGERDQALATLEQAVLRGFDDGDAIEKDADLAPLRGHARFSTAVAAARKNKAPCLTAPEFRQLDFWVGDWDVHDAAGQKIGNSKVEKLLGECVIFESWTDARGRQGRSFNLWDARTKRWRQVWVDDFGSLREYRGTFEGGAMRYQSQGKGRDGKPQLIKMTFTPMPDGSVRQLIETSADRGKSWAAGFDGRYTRRK